MAEIIPFPGAPRRGISSQPSEAHETASAHPVESEGLSHPARLHSPESELSVLSYGRIELQPLGLTDEEIAEILARVGQRNYERRQRHGIQQEEFEP